MFRPGILLTGCLLACAACLENPAGEAIAPAGVHLGPWLMHPEPQQLTVAWTTRLPVLGEVDYWPADAQPVSPQLRSAQDSRITTDHRVLLTGLLPSTKYEYLIHGSAHVGGSFTSAPDPAADAFAHPFTVLVYGDNRTNGGDHALVVNAAESQGAQLALHTGDMVVNAKDQHAWAHWFDVERDLLSSTPIVPTMGNHEITDNGVTYSRHFLTPGLPAYHSLDYGNVHIQVLDSFEQIAGADPHAGAVSEAQKLWSEADAKTVPQDHHLWMLVHQGPYTHPIEMRAGHGGLPGVRQMIAQDQKSHPVEAVFAGHEHFYERGEIDGLRYFVIGGGGAPLEDPDPKGAGVKLAVKELSFVVLQVCGCHVTGKTLDIKGHAFDSFTLSTCERPCEVPGFIVQDVAPAMPLVAIPMVGTQNIGTATTSAPSFPDAGVAR